MDWLSRAIRRAGVLAVLCTAGLTPVQTEQIAPLRDLQAAFLLNFVRFTEWPNAAVDAPLTLCVAGDSGVADALEKAVVGERAGGHALRVQRPGNRPEVTCQLLFVDDAAVDERAELLRRVREHPVLTVSDRRGFARDTGIIELYTEDGRMRFAINVDAAQRARLRLSSRLLGLAKVVHDARR